jgi:hypothetical protein
MAPGTPALGSVAFPTPGAGVPQAPPNARNAAIAGGGGSRGTLLGIAAVLGVLSLGAIVFAMRGSGGESAVPLAFDAGPPQAVLDLLDAAAPPAIPALPADTPLGPLAPSTPVSHGGGRHETHDGGTAKEAHDAGGAKEPLPAPIASTPHLFPPGFGGATVPPPPPPQPAGV